MLLGVPARDACPCPLQVAIQLEGDVCTDTVTMGVLPCFFGLLSRLMNNVLDEFNYYGASGSLWALCKDDSSEISKLKRRHNALLTS